MRNFEKANKTGDNEPLAVATPEETVLSAAFALAWPWQRRTHEIRSTGKKKSVRFSGLMVRGRAHSDYEELSLGEIRLEPAS